MAEDFEISHDKSVGDLGREAFWFVVHTVIAIVTLIALVILISVFHPDPNAATPKLLMMLLALAVPMGVGLVIARQTHTEIARYVWISGLLIFAAACVWVVDLPTGPGMCEQCGPGHLIERIWRTFFSLDNGSGLLGGQGVLIGCWIPFALVGYALGAKVGLEHDPR